MDDVDVSVGNDSVSDLIGVGIGESDRSVFDTPLDTVDKNFELVTLFVRLDLEPKNLSTVQREIIQKWLRSGTNRIFLKDEDCIKYSGLLSPVSGTKSKMLSSCQERRKPANLLCHKVNTDCSEVMFYTIWAHNFHGYFPCLRRLPPHSGASDSSLD